MSAPSGTAHEDVDLHGRISGARDLPEALSIVFDSILIPEGVERALVLLRDGDEFRGIMGMGFDGVTYESISIPAEYQTNPPLDPTLRQIVTITAPAGIGYDHGMVPAFPLVGGETDDSPFGLILIGPASRGARIPPSVSQRLSAAVPMLARVHERDTLAVDFSKLEQQRDLLTAIVNALPDPVLITDAENAVVLENRRAGSLFTTTEGDSDGRRRAVGINNLLFSSFLTKSAIGGRIAEEPSRELNLVDSTEGGDLLFEVLFTPLPPNVAGEVANLSVLRDVTDLKRATTELEHQFKRVRQAEIKSRGERDRLNLILENVGDPILVTDELSNIILMNREAERLFEIPTDAVVDPHTRQDVRANDTKFSSLNSDFALSPHFTRITQIDLTTPETGIAFPAEVVSGKVLNERGEMTAIVSIVHDLTKAAENERLAGELGKLNESLEDRIRGATLELEERNRQLEWQREELERAYRLKSQFLASMSHELRTPINALLGYTSLMRDQIYGELNRRQEEALSRMYTASQHLLELVNDILDLAKIEAGKMPVHIERVDVRQLLRELSQTIEPMVRRKNLDYRTDLDPDLPPIMTDSTKVKQVVLNLLSNAVKFTHEGSVSVTTRAADRDGILIIVEDTGIGIQAEDLDKIFEDFRQVDQSSTREYGGTGLGLSITRKLLNLLGGTVRVSSQLGVGTTFTVWLPREGTEILLDEDVPGLVQGLEGAGG